MRLVEASALSAGLSKWRAARCGSWRHPLSLLALLHVGLLPALLTQHLMIQFWILVLERRDSQIVVMHESCQNWALMIV